MGVQGDILKARRLLQDSSTQGIIACLAIMQRYPRNPSVRALVAKMDATARAAVIADAERLLDHGAAGQALAILTPLVLGHPADPAIAKAEHDCLVKLGRTAEARAAILRGLAAQPDQPMLLGLLGYLQYEAGELPEALDTFRTAARLAPTHGTILAYFSMLAQGMGEADQAVERLLRAVATSQPEPLVWYALSGHINFRDHPELADRLRARVDRPGDSDTARELLCFAASKAAFDLGDPEQAFAYLDRANALHVDTCDPDGARHAARQEDLRRMERLPASAVLHDRPADTPEILLVIGMPRSGTTLIERILSAHPEVQGLGEQPTLMQAVPAIDGTGTIWGEAELTRLADLYRDAIRSRATGNPRFIVDKMPCNAFFAAHALAAMPEVKVLHMQRHPVATALSNWRLRYTVANDFAYSMDGILSESRMTVQAVDMLAARFPDRVGRVVYERLTESPEPEIAALLDWLDLSHEDSCLRFSGAKGVVLTASARQVRKGIYTGSSEAWRRYAHRIAPLIDGLSDLSQDHAAARSALPLGTRPA